MDIKIIADSLVVEKSPRGGKTVALNNISIASKEFYEKWYDALTSGNYRQTYGKLCNVDKDTYCCLGVICREYGYTPELMKTAGHLHPLNNKIVRLPKGVRRNDGWNIFFAGLNDDIKLNFDEIAEVIKYIIDHHLYRNGE